MPLRGNPSGHQTISGSMTNQIAIYEYEYDFYCPMCGAKVVDMNTDQQTINACKHLKYASLSEAPGMPEYVADGLGDILVSETCELENVQAVDKAINGPTMRFQLGGGNGYIDLYLIFEVLYENE